MKKKHPIECVGQHHFEAQELNGEIYVVCRKCGIMIDEKHKKWPMEEGEREMWAVLGVSGGIYAFTHSSWKAREIQKDYWNIGHRKPIKYLVSFKRLNDH